jgi:hypothetical protein
VWDKNRGSKERDREREVVREILCEREMGGRKRGGEINI